MISLLSICAVCLVLCLTIGFISFLNYKTVDSLTKKIMARDFIEYKSMEEPVKKEEKKEHFPKVKL